MSTGNSIGYPITWEVVDTVTEADGFNDNRKVKVGFFDADDDNVVDNPELFEIYVEPTLSESTKFVFFEKYTQIMKEGYNISLSQIKNDMKIKSNCSVQKALKYIICNP